MYKSGCNQNSSAEMLGTEQERRWNSQAWKFSDEERKTTARRRNKENNEETGDVKPEVVIGLRTARFAGVSSGKAVNSRVACRLLARARRV